MNQKKADYKTNVPRPEGIKVTKTKPTIEELKEYRAAWLKEGEESGVIDDLFLIVKTFGKFPFPGYSCLRRFEFTDGDSDYVILLDREVWGVGKETVTAWEKVVVVEGGEYMLEGVNGKMLVSYYRRLELSPAEKHSRAPANDGEKTEANFYIPGYWTGLIEEFANDAKHELGKASTDKARNERAQLLNDLNLS